MNNFIPGTKYKVLEPYLPENSLYFSKHWVEGKVLTEKELQIAPGSFNYDYYQYLLNLWFDSGKLKLTRNE